MKKLLVRAPMKQADLTQLQEFFDEIDYLPWNDTGERFYEEQMVRVLTEKKPTALITELDVISEKVLDSYPDLLFIGDCRASPENIDIAACNKHQLPVLCTPARNAQAVAELWLSTVIAFERHLVPAVNWANAGAWQKGTTPYHLWMGNEIRKKKVGFVGFGAVAQTIAQLLAGFDMDMFFYDPFLQTNVPNCQPVKLDLLFKECDYVSIHLPSNDQTKGMITKELLAKMRSSAIFINTSRSAVVNTNDLYDALKNQRIRGAILDVLDHEPPTAADEKISQQKNVLLTPHIYGASYQVVDHQSAILTRKIRRFFAKEQLEKSVFNYQEIKESLR